MELLFAREARSDLPMSHSARMQVGQAAIKPQTNIPESKLIRPTRKHQAQATSHLFPVGANVMYKTPHQANCGTQVKSSIPCRIAFYTS